MHFTIAVLMSTAHASLCVRFKMIEKSFGKAHEQASTQWYKISPNEDGSFEYQCESGQGISGIWAFGSGVGREYSIGCAQLEGISIQESTWVDNKKETPGRSSFTIKCPSDHEVVTGLGSKVTEDGKDRTFYISCANSRTA